MLSPGPGKKHSICLGNAACVRGHFVRECTKSRPSNTPTGNEIPNVIHTRSLMSIETSSFCNASIPRREGEPYLGGRWPSISNFSQFISLPKSNRTMMSGINQTLTPHIQDWDMYPFLSAQICLLSCWGSLAADLSPFFFLFFFSLQPLASIRQLEDCAWKVQGPSTEKSKKATCSELLYLSHFITVLFSLMCCRKCS